MVKRFFIIVAVFAVCETIALALEWLRYQLWFVQRHIVGSFISVNGLFEVVVILIIVPILMTRGVLRRMRW